MSQLERFRKTTEHVVGMFQKPEVLAHLRQDKFFNIKYLQENHGVRSAAASAHCFCSPTCRHSSIRTI